MKSRRGVLALIAAVGLSTVSWAQNKTANGQKAGAGEGIFRTNCILCHGSDGHSQTTLGKQLGALDLHSDEVQKKKDAELKNVIIHGQKNMPSFDGELSSSQVDEVLAYVRQLGKKK